MDVAQFGVVDYQYQHATDVLVAKFESRFANLVVDFWTGGMGNRFLDDTPKNGPGLVC